MTCGIYRTLLLALLLTGCQTSPSWQVTHLEGQDPIYDSARLSYPVRDIVNEIGVEMICTQGQVNTYLEVHSHAIPSYQGNPTQARVALKIDGKTTPGIALRREGGQRVRLPSSLHELLVEALKQKRPVTILLDGYSTTLDANHFAKHYETLLSKPFKLPFKSYG